MDLKILFNWLKEYINIDLTVENFAKKVSKHGVSLEKWYYLENLNDFLLNIEVTPNRVDMASVIGLANEVKAIMDIPLLKNPYTLKNIQTNSNHSQIQIEVRDRNLCRRYQGIVIKNVLVEESPKWLKDRVESAGFNSINNIVDITNYVLLEYGQPIHAFDLDKIYGDKIIVRNANDGELFYVIGGSEYKLRSDDLVIADTDKILALAGVKGGSFAEVTYNTKNIFIECANFDPVSVRKTSRYHSLITDASLLFEKWISPKLTEFALGRVINLVLDLAKGNIDSDIVETEFFETKKKIEFNTSIVNKMLGVEINQDKIIEILENLNFCITRKEDIIEVEIPFYRENDINYDYDLVEEVARIYGYDNIPNQPINTLSVNVKSDNQFLVEDKLRYTLSNLGFTETYTYSFLSQKYLDLTNSIDYSVKIYNPLSTDFEYMRTSLLSSLLKVLEENEDHQEVIKLFEISNVYIKISENDLPIEQTRLAMLIASNNLEWNFYSLRSYLDFIFKIFDVNDVRFESLQLSNVKENYIELFSAINSAAIKYEDLLIGCIGLVNQSVKNKLHIKKNVAILELNFQNFVNLISSNSKNSKIISVQKFPSVFRDLSFLVPVNILWEDIKKVVIQNSGPYFVKLELFDLYQGRNIPKDKKSISFRLEWNSEDKTLNDTEINQIVDSIVNSLSELNCVLRY